MGKKKQLRKKPSHNKQTQQQQQHRDGSDGATTNGSSNNSHGTFSKIIPQLKSTDLTVRHSTLAALLHTTFQLPVVPSQSPINTTTNFNNEEEEESTNHPSQIPRNLLVAIRDQIVRIHFHANTGSNSTRNTKNDKHNRQQLTEQLYCCTLATECFNHYLIQCSSVPTPPTDTTTIKNQRASEEWCAGWILIFVARIQEYCHHYQSLSPNHPATTGGGAITTTVDVLYTQFIEQCVMAMTLLLEYTPQYTTQRLVTYHEKQHQPYHTTKHPNRNQPNMTQNNTTNDTNSNSTTGDINVLVLMCSVLQFVAQHVQSSRNTTTTNTTNNIHHHHHHHALFVSVQCAIVKFLYALGVNGDLELLLPPPPAAAITTTTNLVPLLTNIIMTPCAPDHHVINEPAMTTELIRPLSDTIMNINTKLYSIGTVIIAMITTNTDSDSDTIEATLTQCVQYVQRLISPSKDSSNSVTIVTSTTHSDTGSILNHLQSTALSQQLRQSYDMYDQEQNDQRLDREIIAEQHQKQEPARTIAQRLTSQSKSIPTEKIAQLASDMDIPSSDHTNENTNETKRKKKSAPSGTTKSPKSWEEMQTEWYATVKPIQLSLELILHWISLLGSTSSNNTDSDVDEEREITIPLSTSSLRMDVDDDGDDDDEYDARMHTDDDGDDDDDGISDFRNSKTLQRVLRTCTIFCTVYDLYTFLRQWYKANVIPLEPSPPLTLIRETISDILSKTIVVIGQLYICNDGSIISGIDNESFDNATLTLWRDFYNILMSTNVNILAEPKPKMHEDDDAMTIPIDDGSNTDIRSTIDTTTPVLSLSSTTTNITANESRKTEACINVCVKSTVQLQESITSAMVAIVRHGTRSSNSSGGSTATRFTVTSILHDLINVLQQYSVPIDAQNRHPIVVRDVICMIGIILVSESSSTASPTILDQDIETATRTLLQTSTSFLSSPESLSSPLTTTKNMTVSVSDIDDDTNSPKTGDTAASLALARKTRLIVVMEILNVLMDVFSDDDVVGSMKHNLFYHPFTILKSSNSISPTAWSVQNFFERTIPTMKQDLFLYRHTIRPTNTSNRIHTTNHNDDSLPDEQLYDAWQEIMENSIRFVQYKKEHQ